MYNSPYPYQNYCFWINPNLGEALLRVTRDKLQDVLEQIAMVQECRNAEAPEPLGRTIGELDALRELRRILEDQC